MQTNAQLPLVDPEFRLVERRPQKLHSYARGLLQHLRAIRAGDKAGGYPIATIKAAAVWLIESYAEAPVAPAPEAALLVSEIVLPDPDASTLPVRRSSEIPYWAAIEFEARSRGLIQSLREKSISVTPYKPDTDKHSRVIAQTDLLEAGSVRFPQRASWLEEFTAELLAFPARHDDQVGALVQGLAWKRGRRGEVSVSVVGGLI